ncbi:homoserine kinase [Marininema mesophilum]|uniref:Homoserine kinase n=1 Tax=Marininema mesophilum TaxID=1048340 RepID=A0A1H2S5R4_9BACL|nr:homoserine kinase [Marininema mesophilum]SDW26951.1 homoserine kinase [Marininema mesophilum]
MREFEPFEVKVPGSTANLGSGFDSIGLALNRFLYLRVEPSDELQFHAVGNELARLNQSEENLIFRVMEPLFHQAGKSFSSMRIEVESEIPLARGLGSSASAIVGSLMAANHLLDNPFSKDELFQLATKWEGHPDNVGASLYGGVVIASWDGEKAHCVKAQAPPFPILVAIPDTSLATSRAREVLPDHMEHADAVLASSRANLLTAAMLTGDREALRVGMQDRFHQPYRLSLIPGLEELISEAPNQGAIGVALSGAGPTVIAFTEDEEKTFHYMESVFRKNSTSVRILRLDSCSEGVTLHLTKDVAPSKVVGKIKGENR